MLCALCKGIIAFIKINFNYEVLRKEMAKLAHVSIMR